MQAELAIWRPLWDVTLVLFVLGLGVSLTSRDRSSWWTSQGLLLLSVVVGFAAADAMHAAADLFWLGVGIPLVMVAGWLGRVRIRRLATVRGNQDDRSV